MSGRTTNFPATGEGARKAFQVGRDVALRIVARKDECGGSRQLIAGEEGNDEWPQVRFVARGETPDGENDESFILTLGRAGIVFWLNAVDMEEGQTNREAVTAT